MNRKNIIILAIGIAIGYFACMANMMLTIRID